MKHTAPQYRCMGHCKPSPETGRCELCSKPLRSKSKIAQESVDQSANHTAQSKQNPHNIA